ncbi:hypothetical protein SKAU_G00162550 [Synaphobranchus kaupii]|uniref:Uncharacterized protein n=1 Tax=Synaphobranchus kaupii TaxID=118154 RepID=A0A9Q1IZW9_SYNKA|nr:hypothetical protein SKAU_G00162550 [Synaphobranchus kaupii]
MGGKKPPHKPWEVFLINLLTDKCRRRAGPQSEARNAHKALHKPAVGRARVQGFEEQRSGRLSSSQTPAADLLFLPSCIVAVCSEGNQGEAAEPGLHGSECHTRARPRPPGPGAPARIKIRRMCEGIRRPQIKDAPLWTQTLQNAAAATTAAFTHSLRREEDKEPTFLRMEGWGVGVSTAGGGFKTCCLSSCCYLTQA